MSYHQKQFLVVTEAKLILLTHDRSLSWLDTGTSIKCGRVKLVTRAKTQFEYNINVKLKKKYIYLNKVNKDFCENCQPSNILYKLAKYFMLLQAQ